MTPDQLRPLPSIPPVGPMAPATLAFLAWEDGPVTRMRGARAINGDWDQYMSEDFTDGRLVGVGARVYRYIGEDMNGLGPMLFRWVNR